MIKRRKNCEFYFAKLLLKLVTKMLKKINLWSKPSVTDTGINANATLNQLQTFQIDLFDIQLIVSEEFILYLSHFV